MLLQYSENKRDMQIKISFFWDILNITTIFVQSLILSLWERMKKHRPKWLVLHLNF